MHAQSGDVRGSAPPQGPLPSRDARTNTPQSAFLCYAARDSWALMRPRSPQG